MRLIGLTRFALGLQILLGLALWAVAYGGSALNILLQGSAPVVGRVISALYEFVVTAHVALALAIPVLALVAMRPGRPGMPGGTTQVAAWLTPLAPLALGLGFHYEVFGGLALVALHTVLGFVAFGLVAMVQGRVRAEDGLERSKGSQRA